MSTAATRLSPAVNLLRNSRLFAVPAPIPSPSHSGSSQGTFDSETATLPYPTHAAIQTYPSALQQGDWGLKRSLPTKSTARGSKTAIRIRGAFDTIEHIADFESAGDHVVTLQKWQSLHLPITRPAERRQIGGRDHKSGGPQSSVFEDKNDGISQTENDQQLRWRFHGPYLQGISGFEFENYLRDVRAKKGSFREYIEGVLQRRRTNTADEFERDNAQASDQSKAVGGMDAEIDSYIKYLRKNPEELGDTLSDFLDLPGGPGAFTESSPSTSLKTPMLPTLRTSNLSSEQYAISGPPKTHPSAGLSYLLSAAYLNNYPEYGPTPHRPLIYSRVLKFDNVNDSGIYGVAGFVTSNLVDESLFKQEQSSRPTSKDSTHPTIKYARRNPAGGGGKKTFTQVLQASFGSDGRLELALGRPTDMAEAISDCEKPFNRNNSESRLEEDRRAMDDKIKRRVNDSGQMQQMDKAYQDRKSRPRSRYGGQINQMILGKLDDQNGSVTR